MKKIIDAVTEVLFGVAFLGCVGVFGICVYEIWRTTK